MSQAKILDILTSLGGTATTSEIRQKTREKYPNRSMHSYAQIRLKSLENRKLVESRSSDRDVIWELTEEGEQKSTEQHTISESCDEYSKSKLNKFGVQIGNIVATIDSGYELDLLELENLDGTTVYEFERDSYLSYYPEKDGNMVIRVPASGVLNIAGAKSKKQLLEGLNKFCEDLHNNGISIQIEEEEIIVQNIVASVDLGKEYDLAALARDMDFEDLHYNSDKHPGIVIRPNIQGSITLYRTGKANLTGLKSYDQVLILHQELVSTLEKLDS